MQLQQFKLVAVFFYILSIASLAHQTATAPATSTSTAMQLFELLF